MIARLPRALRRVFMAAIILLCLGVLALCAMILFVFWRETHLPAALPSDAIIVLGAQVKPDGTPSVALERRLTVALEAYEAQPQVIIVCGAQGANEPVAEGELMRQWLLARGVRPDLVVAETASYNTRQNLDNARAIMESRGLAQALIVTSDYHVARALELCKQAGISATGLGSPSKPEYFLKNHIQESLSWIKFWLESAFR